MGGPAHQVALLSGRSFLPERYETRLVHGRLATGEESAAHLSEAEGADLVYLDRLGQPISPPNDAWALSSLRRLISAYRPHILHTHTAKAGLIGRTAALSLPRAVRPSLVHTFHGHVLEGYFGPRKSAIFTGLERRLARRTDCLIGVSDATVSDLARLGVAPAEGMKVVPLGLDLAPFAAGRHAEEAAALRADLGIAPDAFVCVFVGRFAAIKRLDDLLTAFILARASTARLHLVLVGDGPQAAELEQRATREGVGKTVHLLGYRRDLRTIYAAADIAVLASANEGTPVSLIEAGASGLPAAATEVGGVASVVEHGRTGMLVSAHEPGELAAAITGLAADRPARREMGLAAKKKMLREFSAERLYRDIDAIYEALLARPPRQRTPEG